MADAVIVVVLLLEAATATVGGVIRNPARQALVLSLLGIVLAVLFTVLQAPDVGLSQLAVGSVRSRRRRTPGGTSTSRRAATPGRSRR